MHTKSNNNLTYLENDAENKTLKNNQEILNYFDKMEEKPNWSKEKFKQGVEILPCDINTTTRIWHLFGQYKVKGLGKEAETFYEISKKIVDVSKIFEYYNNMGEQMSKDASNWIQGLDEEAPVEGVDEEKVLTNQELRPKQ